MLRSVALVFFVAVCVTAEKLPHNGGGGGSGLHDGGNHGGGHHDGGHTDGGHHDGGNHVNSVAAAPSSSYSEAPASPVHLAPAPALVPAPAPPPAPAAVPHGGAHSPAKEVHHGNPAPASPQGAYAAPEAHGNTQPEQQGYYYYYYPVESQGQKPKGGLFGGDLGNFGTTIIVGLVVLGCILLLVTLLGIETARAFTWVPSIPSIDIPYNEMLDIAQKVYTALQKEY